MLLFKPLFDFVSGLVMHRGFSHSLLFFAISSPILGYLIQKIYKDKTSVWDWINFSFWVMLTHAILDSFTSWGTELLWPMPTRVAWNNIFVADLLYTIPLIVCLIWVMRLDKSSAKRRKLNFYGLLISTLYMGLTFFNKSLANNSIRRFSSHFSN